MCIDTLSLHDALPIYLADENRTEEWLDTLNDAHTKTVAVAANSQDDIKKVINLIESVGLEAQKNMTDKGVNRDRKSTRLNSSHVAISYAVFCLKKKKT